MFFPIDHGGVKPISVLHILDCEDLVMSELVNHDSPYINSEGQ